MQAILKAWPSRVYFAIRIFFALLLATSAIGKLANMPGFYQVVDTYQVFPKAFIPFSSWGLVMIELGLALALLAGNFLKTLAAMVFLLHCLYFAWLAIALQRGLDIPNCGCFGVYWARPLTIYTLLEDGFLMLMSWALWQAKHLRSVELQIRPNVSP